jgi:hypothetical protein
MFWPELLKAKKNLHEIEDELDRLLRNHNSLTKKEIAKQHDTLLAEFDSSFLMINGKLDEFMDNIENHKKYIKAKSRFINRHYKRV